VQASQEVNDPLHPSEIIDEQTENQAKSHLRMG